MRRGPLWSVLILATAAAAQEPDTPEQAADRVLAAFQAQQDLKTLAAENLPDPWRVADELCFRGEYDAADAFAKAAPRKDTAKLPGYVASRRGRKPDSAARNALAAALDALEANRPEDALTAVASVQAQRDTVVLLLMLDARGTAQRELRKLEEGVASHVQAAEAALRIGWLARAQSSLVEAATTAEKSDDLHKAAALLDRARASAESRGDLRGLADVLNRLAQTQLRFGEAAVARQHGERAVEIARGIRDARMEAMGLKTLGHACRQLGDAEGSVNFLKQALEISERLEDRRQVAGTLGAMGQAHLERGNLPESISCQQRSLGLQRELKDEWNIAACLINLGIAQKEIGNYVAARASYDEALALATRLESTFLTAATQVNKGYLLEGMGDFEHAADCHEQTLRYARASRNASLEASCLLGLGGASVHRGQYGGALAYFEQALALSGKIDDQVGAAAALGLVGAAYHRLGDYDRALSYLERALEAKEKNGNAIEVARTLNNMALVYNDQGEFEKAIAAYRRSFRIARDSRSLEVEAIGIMNLSSLYLGRGQYARALELQERALELDRQIGDEHGVALSLSILARAQAGLGNHAEAIRQARRSVALGKRLQSDQAVLAGRVALVHAYTVAGDDAEAVELARTSVEELGKLIGGLGEEQGAMARTQFRELFDFGLEGACRLADVDAACFFMESGRAGALLESLGGAEALQRAILPADVQQQLDEAEAAQRVATWHYRKALAGGKRKTIGERRAALYAASDQVTEAVERIRREAKAAANVAYPRADPLARIQGYLDAADVLVVYGLLTEAAVALVVTRDEARIVALGPREKIEAAARAGRDRPDRLRELVVDPLRLPGEALRVLISPDGALSYVPFVLLVGEREVAYLPSATTYGVLRDHRSERGHGVLALGDPDYEAGSENTDLLPGGAFTPLPATREEAERVGDEVLLGAKATEAELVAALGRQARRRAVHLACHGVVDPDRPMLSSLVLTPTEGSDGYLTCLEVFRMKIPADLVVLSACETAKGKVYRAEGVIGFTRAFMLAGAPRVLVSLWKVDDEATRALMVRLYELWKPGKMSTATALRKAQAFVASHERWRDPRYWAAWQLWGLPD